MKISGNLPSTLVAACKRMGDAVESVWSETSSGDGYWILLSDRYHNAEAQTACIHEFTVADCIRALKESVKLKPVSS